MKVGDYVRTNKGNVAKIIKITDLTIMCDNIVYPVNNYGFNKQLKKESLKRLGVKSSPNIIDLIEVGDILTIRDIFGNLSKVEVDENFKLLSGKIISIVTKEAFESMEYRIGE